MQKHEYRKELEIIKRYKASQPVISYGYGKEKKMEFLQQAYTNWALEEILKLCGNNITEDPRLLLTYFSDRMDECSCECAKTSLPFSVAKDVAEDLYFEIVKEDMFDGLQERGDQVKLYRF